MPQSHATGSESEARCRLCGARLPVPSTKTRGCVQCGHGVWFRTRTAGHLVVFDLLPEMNPEEAAVDHFLDLVSPPRRAPRLLLNMHRIDFVTSTFVNRLLILRRKVRDARGRLLLCSLSPVVREIFEVNKLEQLFDVFVNERDAVGEP